MYKKVDTKGDRVQVGTVQQKHVEDGQPMVLVQMPGSVADVYRRMCAKNLSYIMLIIGSLAVVIQIGAVVVAAGITRNAVPGFWAGCIFVVCGALGLVSANNITRAHVRAFLAFSIISIVAACIMIVLASTGMGEDRDADAAGRVKDLRARYALNGTLVALAVIMLILCIVSSVLCCNALCKRATQMVGVKGHVEYKETSDKGRQKLVVVPDN